VVGEVLVKHRGHPADAFLPGTKHLSQCACGVLSPESVLVFIVAPENTTALRNAVRV
jgi:hypothetical protein